MSDRVASGLSVPWDVAAKWVGRLLFVIALWIGNQYLERLDTLTKIQIEQTQQLTELTRRSKGQWTVIDQTLWATLLARDNPTIIVPEPIHVNLPGEQP